MKYNKCTVKRKEIKHKYRSINFNKMNPPFLSINWPTPFRTLSQSLIPFPQSNHYPEGIPQLISFTLFFKKTFILEYYFVSGFFSPSHYYICKFIHVFPITIVCTFLLLYSVHCVTYQFVHFTVISRVVSGVRLFPVSGCCTC